MSDTTTPRVGSGRLRLRFAAPSLATRREGLAGLELQRRPASPAMAIAGSGQAQQGGAFEPVNEDKSSPMKRLRRTVALAALLLASGAAHAATDPFMGVWRLDKAKSLIANDPGVKSKEIRIIPTGDGGLITETLEMKSGNLGKQVTQLSFSYGRPVRQTRPGIDSFTVVKDGTDRVFWTAQFQGKTVARLQVDLSQGGEVMTFRYLMSAADPTGKVTSDRYVYDRQ